jgi:putative glycosyltransferase (TIGR04372 family)
MNSLKKIIKAIYGITDLLLVSIFSTCILLINANKIKKHQNLLIFNEGGFGHTITGMDIYCGLNKSRKLIIFFHQGKRHNIELNKIWIDCEFIYIRRSLLELNPWQSIFYFKWIFNLVNLIFEGKLKIVQAYGNQSLEKYELYESYIHQFKPMIPTDVSIDKDHLWTAYWYRSINEGNKKNFHLAEDAVNSFKKKLLEVTKSQCKFITLYFREKGRDEEGLRSGVDFDVLISAIKFIELSGYKILLMGDRSVENCPIELRHNFIDYAQLSVKKEAFDILAPYVSEKFIGDPGGALFLPALYKKQMLVINCFPYGAAFSNSLILYKKIIHKRTGAICSIAEALSRFAWQYTIPNYVVVPNTKEELLQAVKIFLSSDAGMPKISEVDTHSHSWIRESKSTILDIERV